MPRGNPIPREQRRKAGPKNIKTLEWWQRKYSWTPQFCGDCGDELIAYPANILEGSIGEDGNPTSIIFVCDMCLMMRAPDWLLDGEEHGIEESIQTDIRPSGPSGVDGERPKRGPRKWRHS